MTTFLIIGDPHMGESNTRIPELIKDLNISKSLSPTGQIDRIFCTGDFEGIPQFDQAHKTSILSSIPAYIIPGNHDISNISNIKKYQGFGDKLNPGPIGTEKTTFSLDYNEIHITMLNLYWDGKTNEGWKGGGKSGGEVGSTILTWLKTDLQSAKTPYKIVLAHEPMYPDKRHKGDSLDWNIAIRNNLQKVLEDNGVDAFFSGHTHYARGDLINGKVLQVQNGVPGAKAGTTGDKYRSMWFVHIAQNGSMIITWKHNSNNSSNWTNPIIKTWTLPQGITPPIEKITCSFVPQLQ
jgi:3',5'-cyclic AMP phosphodiesterase CpdA